MSKEKLPLISIIVPVYQVAPYLCECLDSILAQSFTDWEMLLVDDGSTDGGELICDRYGSRDPRIRVFHQENRGLSAARNTGLDNARGQYYTMVDSDDVLATNDYLKKLYVALVENNADMSACGHIWFSDGAIVPSAIDSQMGTRIFTGKEFYFQRGLWERKNYTDYQGNLFTIDYSPYGAHGKLYKRELFEGIRYPEGHILEDLAVAHRIYLFSEQIAVLGTFMYAYRRRAGSILRSNKNVTIFQERIFAYNDLLSFSIENGDQATADKAAKILRWMLRNRA